MSGSMVIRCLWGLLWLSCSAGSVAQPLPLAWSQLTSGDQDSAAYGNAVAMNEKWLVVGMPNKTNYNCPSGTCTDSGRVYVMRWRGGRWHPYTSLETSSIWGGNSANTRFGAAVALSGDRVLIGCPGCAFEHRAFLVHLFDLPPGRGEPEFEVWPIAAPASLQSPIDPQHGIGRSVALAGNVLALGAPRATVGSVERGAVVVGRFNAGTVVWEDQFTGWPGSRFGHAIALTSTRINDMLQQHALLVGAPQYVPAGGFGLAGRAQLFHRGINAVWGAGQVFDNTQPGLADALGTSVALYRPTVSMGRLALGAPGRQVSGAAAGAVQLYMYDSASSSFSFSQQVQSPGPWAAFDRFGASVSVHGDTLLVGADGRDANLTDSGSAFLYTYGPASPGPGSAWALRQSLLHPGAQDGDRLGVAVALFDKRAVVSALQQSMPPGIDNGAVHTFVCDQLLADSFEAGTTYRCSEPP